MVDICLHGIANKYRAFLKNLTFPSFYKLMEAARRTNELVMRTPRPSLASHLGPATGPFSRKRPIVAAVEQSQETKPSRSKKHSFRQEYKSENKQGKKAYHVLQPSPCGIKKATAPRTINQRCRHLSAECRPIAF